MAHLRFFARTAAAVALLTAALPLPASVQSTAVTSTRVWATINAIHDSVVNMTDTPGSKATMTPLADISVTQVVPIEPSVIRAGSYIGTAAVREPDNTLRALEVHMFPEAMRGTGDGHRPYDLGPSSSMTNGTIERAGAVTGVQGRMLSVKYKGREQRIVMPPQVPIVAFESGRHDDLKTGTHVTMFVRADAQGTLAVQRMLVGKGGMVPPM